ncbi:hypothetical protein HU200_027928 [Digitaria exilis]|uniref:Uncharacterized protein n=1 Tax=Digitaria exilis TaxID=1010633 RepID=A0A835C496_9POAL|nr:hypothetical protein HU200_027928 [Digitaria exilis]
MIETDKELQSTGPLAPFPILGRVDVGKRRQNGCDHNDDEELPTAAVEVVAGAVLAGGAEHRRVPAEQRSLTFQRRLGKLQLLARDGVPDGQAGLRGSAHRRQDADEDAAVAGVERVPAAEVGVPRAEGGGGREAARGAGVGDVQERAVEAAQHWRRAVALAEAAAEARARDDAAPAPADEGGAGEVGGVVRRGAEQDLLDELVHARHRRRRIHRGDGRRRGFGWGKVEWRRSGKRLSWTGLDWAGRVDVDPGN